MTVIVYKCWEIDGLIKDIENEHNKINGTPTTLEIKLYYPTYYLHNNSKPFRTTTIFVIDVAEGDKIPRKGGPGITRSDILVINKIDLAPYVGASLEVMERDSKKMRGDRPFQFTNIRGDENVDKVVEWIKKNVLLEGM